MKKNILMFAVLVFSLAPYCGFAGTSVASTKLSPKLSEGTPLPTICPNGLPCPANLETR
jgi:hypothetical protein